MKNSRLIQDWYYTTDEPFTGNPKLWESGNADSVEYGLAGIDVRPFEQLIVEVQVLSPSSDIQKINPRLQIVPAHDYAVDNALPTTRMLAYSICGVGIAAVALLFFKAGRRYLPLQENSNKS